MNEDLSICSPLYQFHICIEFILLVCCICLYFSKSKEYQPIQCEV